MNESLARLSRTSGGRARGGFTLIELLVVMGVIAVLAVLTLMSMRAIANDARLASATNSVKAALANARALAMKNNTLVLIVFRPRLVGVHKHKQEVDIYTAKWTGESILNLNHAKVVDRFVPIPAIAVRTIPAGIKVTAPRYGKDEDDVWITQSHLPAIDQETGVGEDPGKMIAIMYGPDGTTITRNSQSDANTNFIGFDNDGLQQVGIDVNDQTFEDDEPFLAIAPFLAVFDDDEAREIFDTALWTDPDTRDGDLTEYITQFATRIHFNRYTGVVMK
ncbi:MAG: prepilin-type N-terminal cleavage/methylation domain-containing protein [Phycisphaerales bacterium]